VSSQQTLRGTCDTKSISIDLVEHGILRIENDYREYKIVLPKDQDSVWLSYRFGDEYAWIGNCSGAAYPYEDSFCQRIMTKISSIGFF
jgi:hypothetical protein